MQHIIKPSEKGMIKNARVICSGNNQTMRVILFNHDQKAIQNPPDLSNIVQQPRWEPMASNSSKK